ncbi:MAG: HDOD domain-containing protein [Gammaproteobacteria bacterium]|nr:HDOD domain-containing protein [Gammaproteobacteria bacterium]
MYSDPKQLVKDVRDIYSLPTIYYRVDKAINDPATSNAQIGSILSEDVGLSARLLKLSNSAFYNFPSKIDTITAAISVIGTKQVRDLVLASSVIKMFEGIPEDLVKLDSFWAHCIGCGVVARVIAGINRERNVESFFVAGILHDIGSLLIYSKMGEKATEVIRYVNEHQCTLHEAEMKCIGFTHTQVGGYLLKQWKLPKNLIEAVYYHHRPISSRSYPVFASAIHIADIIATAMELGDGGEFYVPDFDKKAWKMSGLKDDAMNQIIPKVSGQFEEIMKVIFE